MNVYDVPTGVITIYLTACIVVLVFLRYDERLYLINNYGGYFVDNIRLQHFTLQINWLLVELSVMLLTCLSLNKLHY